MAPTLHLVRHAQGYHNLSTENHKIHDPQLTPHGKQQCEHLSEVFPHSNQVDLIVASPIKRTIWTALLSFPDVISRKGIKVIALPEMQETSDLPCDTGSDRTELEREFQGQPVDLSLVIDGWNSKKGPWAPASDAIEERCRIARDWLKARPERHIVVVTHGGVLHYFTEDWQDYQKFNGTGWANTEFRSYDFKVDSSSLIETDESRTRRRGTEKPLTEAEQRNLKRTAAIDQDKAGYVKRDSKV